jgi:hypothetical protein
VHASRNAHPRRVSATVTLTGTSVAPKRIVDDLAYIQYCPNLIAFLLTMPFCSLETETIFAPVLDHRFSRS